VCDRICGPVVTDHEEHRERTVVDDSLDLLAVAREQRLTQRGGVTGIDDIEEPFSFKTGQEAVLDLGRGLLG